MSQDNNSQNLPNWAYEISNPSITPHRVVYNNSSYGTPPPNGWPLNPASLYFGNYIDIMQLIDANIDINRRKEPNQDTPAIAHARIDNYTIVELLLEKGADIRLQNKFGETLLHILCRALNWNYSIVRIIQFILNKEPESLFVKNKQGKTPFDVLEHTLYYIKSSKPSFYESEFNIQSSKNYLKNIFVEGDTPLHVLVRGSIWSSARTEMIHSLIENDTDLLFVKNKEGNTPIDILEYNLNNLDYMTHSLSEEDIQSQKEKLEILLEQLYSPNTPFFNKIAKTSKNSFEHTKGEIEASKHGAGAGKGGKRSFSKKQKKKYSKRSKKSHTKRKI